MERLPIYDATVPITCTIGDEERPAQVEVIERMRDHLDRIERTEHGLLLHFPARSDVEADLRHFATVEKGCCTFWGFDIETTDSDLTLRWDGPPSVDELLDRLLAWFQSDEPLTLTSGLL